MRLKGVMEGTMYADLSSREKGQGLNRYWITQHYEEILKMG